MAAGRTEDLIEKAVRCGPVTTVAVPRFDVTLARWRTLTEGFEVGALASPALGIHFGGSPRVRPRRGAAAGRGVSIPGSTMLVPRGVATSWVIENGDFDFASVSIGARSPLGRAILARGERLEIGVSTPFAVDLVRSIFAVASAPELNVAESEAYLEPATETLLRHVMLSRTADSIVDVPLVSAGEWHGARRAIREIHDRCGESLSVADLARAAGSSPSAFGRLFRRVTGSSPHQYLLRVRIERVRSALRSTDAPLADLSLAAGFSSQSHMSNRFRKVVGLTPAAYRTSMRGLSPDVRGRGDERELARNRARFRKK